MIKSFLEWLLSFFQTKKEKQINQKIEDIDNKLEKIEDEKISDDDLLDRLNK